MEGRLRLRHLPALHLWAGSALPHSVGLQPQAAAATARRVHDEEVPALGADEAEGDGLGSRSWLTHSAIKNPPYDGVNVVSGDG